MANNKALQILRGKKNYDPSLISDETLLDGQLFYSKYNNQLYIGDGSDNTISDLQPITSYLCGDPAGEESVSQLSHGAINTEGEKTLQANITTGRSSFTNGQGNRNGGYYGIQTGQNNIQPRLFDMKFPNSTHLTTDIVNAWNEASSNLVGGTDNFVIASNSVVTGEANQSAGSYSLISGVENRDWTEEENPSESNEFQNYIKDYKNYSLFGVDEETGKIKDKNGVTDRYLQDIEFGQIKHAFTIMNGDGNINRSTFSIINGAGNKNFADKSVIVGEKNIAKGSNIYSLGNNNNLTGNNIYSLGNNNNLTGDDIVSLGYNNKSEFGKTVLIGNNITATKETQIVIGTRNPSNDARVSIGGGTDKTIENGKPTVPVGTALEVSTSNWVRIYRRPAKDIHALRRIDIQDGSLYAKFNSIEMKSLEINEDDGSIVETQGSTKIGLNEITTNELLVNSDLMIGDSKEYSLITNNSVETDKITTNSLTINKVLKATDDVIEFEGYDNKDTNATRFFFIKSQLENANGGDAVVWALKKQPGDAAAADWLAHLRWNGELKAQKVLVGIAGKEAIKLNDETGVVQAQTFRATSDRRLKENIIPYSLGEKSILDLPIYEFDYKNSNIHAIGCMAQDLKEICPEIVSEDGAGFLHIEESKIVYLLLQEVKKLREEINNLR